MEMTVEMETYGRRSALKLRCLHHRGSSAKKGNQEWEDGDGGDDDVGASGGGAFGAGTYRECRPLTWSAYW
jgi:hypothetical protein